MGVSHRRLSGGREVAQGPEGADAHLCRPDALPASAGGAGRDDAAHGGDRRRYSWLAYCVGVGLVLGRFQMDDNLTGMMVSIIERVIRDPLMTLIIGGTISFLFQRWIED